MSAADEALTVAHTARIPVLEVLRLIDATRTASANEAWRDACECVEDLVLSYVAEQSGAPQGVEPGAGL